MLHGILDRNIIKDVIKGGALDSVGSFLPNTYSNLVLWLDAHDSSTLTKSANRVSQWTDKSPAGNTVVQATGGSQPLYVASAINSRPAIQFRDDGSTRFFFLTDAVSLDYTALHGFIVFNRLTDLGASETQFGKWSPTSNLREFRSLINSSDFYALQTTSDGSTVVAANVSGAVSTSTNYIGEFNWPGSTTINATKNNGTNVSNTITSVFAGAAPLTVGANGNGGEPFAGYISEILLYKAALSTAQRLQILKYLAQKWAITIA